MNPSWMWLAKGTAKTLLAAFMRMHTDCREWPTHKGEAIVDSHGSDKQAKGLVPVEPKRHDKAWASCDPYKQHIYAI
jgi:hypothetical protein